MTEGQSNKLKLSRAPVHSHSQEQPRESGVPGPFLGPVASGLPLYLSLLTQKPWRRLSHPCWSGSDPVTGQRAGKARGDVRNPRLQEPAPARAGLRWRGHKGRVGAEGHTQEVVSLYLHKALVSSFSVTVVEPLFQVGGQDSRKYRDEWFIPKTLLPRVRAVTVPVRHIVHFPPPLEHCLSTHVA